jgi:hypothetical protein
VTRAAMVGTVATAVATVAMAVPQSGSQQRGPADSRMAGRDARAHSLSRRCSTCRSCWCSRLQNAAQMVVKAAVSEVMVVKASLEATEEETVATEEVEVATEETAAAVALCWDSLSGFGSSRRDRCCNAPPPEGWAAESARESRES